MNCDPFDDDHETAAEAAERGRAETEPSALQWAIVILLGVAAAAYWAFFGEHTQAVVMAGAMATKVDTSRLDPEQLIATGAMSGPHRRTRPVTLTLMQRIHRWARERFGWLLYR